MLCIKCEQKPIRYKQAKMCYGCWQRTRSQANLDNLKVYPCRGECGRRIHNMPGIVIPGIPQGHGAGRAWCYGCSENRVMEPKDVDKGPCVRCNQPMRSGKKTPGFVEHHAKGYCVSCYKYVISDRPIPPYRGPKPQVLTVEKVAQIKKRLLEKQTQKDIALAFGVSRSIVYHINAGNSWGYVDAAV